MQPWIATTLLLMGGFFVPSAFAAGSENLEIIDFTQSWVGYVSLGIFVLAYMFVVAEEFLHLRKSKPVIVSAGLIWVIVAAAYASMGITHTAETMVRHNLLEFAELFLFLLVAMTFINVLDNRNVFAALRTWLINLGLNYRQLFWITGFLAFFISPIADNLTTALLMGAVILAVGKDNAKFVSIGFINVVVAANAGGAFSPFGDITTLMVWQKGILPFFDFFVLFLPSLVNFIIPAAIMHFAVPDERPHNASTIEVKVLQGGFISIGLFLLTIAIAVSMHAALHMPPVIGMMMGLGILMIYSYFIDRSQRRRNEEPGATFDIFKKISNAEWDTLFFFFGVILSVGGLALIGYLSMASEFMYGELGATNANILVGVLSAIVDNIPVMFAVLTMEPSMSEGQWLLVTLTAGVGGSMLSIGSAAGVALMGQSKGMYTFFSHLRWMPVIALGYIASIYTHFLVNSHLF